MIFVFPTEPALVVKAATQGTGIPIVFATGTTEGTGIVESISHPGGDITGVRYPGVESTARRLEILNELIPKARVYLIYDPNFPAAIPLLEELRPTASSLGMTLVEDYATNAEELKTTLQKRAALDDIGIDAILALPDPFDKEFETIIKFTNEHKLPISGAAHFNTDLGALFSFTSYDVDHGKLAATLANKILRGGVPAGTIPVVTPVSYLHVNYKVAQELGLTIPKGLLDMADKVIY